jgi:hypothetical protein
MSAVSPADRIAANHRAFMAARAAAIEDELRLSGSRRRARAGGESIEARDAHSSTALRENAVKGSNLLRDAVLALGGHTAGHQPRGEARTSTAGMVRLSASAAQTGACPRCGARIAHGCEHYPRKEPS